jgi:hypothetical protein
MESVILLLLLALRWGVIGEISPKGTTVRGTKGEERAAGIRSHR